jgi:hypothetical protein
MSVVTRPVTHEGEQAMKKVFEYENGPSQLRNARRARHFVGILQELGQIEPPFSSKRSESDRIPYTQANADRGSGSDPLSVNRLGRSLLVEGQREFIDNCGVTVKPVRSV